MKYGLQKGYKERRRSTHVLLMLIISIFAACTALFLWRMGEIVYDYFARSSRYDTIIVAAGVRNHIDPVLIKAVIWRESRFDRSIRGLKGEIGLMQVMPKYAAVDWARTHNRRVPSSGALFDPQLNIEIGSWYLARALSRYKNYKDAVALALCEYNAGAVRAMDWRPAEPDQPVIDRIAIPSTKAYVKDILKKYEEYKKTKMIQKKERP